jgi:hypothetical protein
MVIQSNGLVKCYAKCILHQHSQFSYVGGNDACTYICNETAIHVLQGVLNHFQEHEILQLIESAIKFGIKNDKGLGHRSCDEVHASCQRFKENLRSGSLYCGKLKDPKVFLKLIENLTEKAKQKGDRGELPLTCVVLTKPPETILLCCDANPNAKYPVIIFDSHPRSFEKGVARNGAGFYMFDSVEGADGHLKQLFPYNEEYYSHLNENMARAHVMYEATLVELSSKAQARFIPLITDIDVPLHKQQVSAPVQQMVISGNVFAINDHFFSPPTPEEEKNEDPAPNVPTSLLANALHFFSGNKEKVEPSQVEEPVMNTPSSVNTTPSTPASSSEENLRLKEENKTLQDQLSAAQQEIKLLQTLLNIEREDKLEMTKQLLTLRSENTAYRMQFEDMIRNKHSI